MKLAIISPFYPYRGGIAKETEILYNHLKKDYSVQVINFSRQYPKLFYPGKDQYVPNLKNKDDNRSVRIIDT